MKHFYKTFCTIAILAVGIVSLWVLPSRTTPSNAAKPDAAYVEAKSPDKRIAVTVESVEFGPLRLVVDSQGFVEPEYKTELISQVQGSIVYLSENFVRGGFVSKGEVLVELDNDDFIASLVEAEAELEKAKADLEIETARGQIAKSDWKRMSDKEPTRLSLRGPQLSQVTARVKATEAALGRARNNLKRTKILAPFDGLVSERSQGFGAFVGNGVKLGTIMSTEVAAVRLPLSDDAMKHLESFGQNAEVTLYSEYLDENVRWHGQIVRNEGVVDRSSRMTYLVAYVKDPYNLGRVSAEQSAPLRFGTYVSAKIQGVVLDRATVVPERFIDNDRMPIMTTSGQLAYMPVTVIKTESGNATIQGDIENGERLVTSPLPYATEGMKLRIATVDTGSGSNTAISQRLTDAQP